LHSCTKNPENQVTAPVFLLTEGEQVATCSIPLSSAALQTKHHIRPAQMNIHDLA
jgi:hypothetical protein